MKPKVGETFRGQRLDPSDRVLIVRPSELPITDDFGGDHATTGAPAMFNGASGSSPAIEAKRYVYAVLRACLYEDLCDPDGWVFGGMSNEADRILAKKAGLVVGKELMRKAKR